MTRPESEPNEFDPYQRSEKLLEELHKEVEDRQLELERGLARSEERRIRHEQQAQEAMRRDQEQEMDDLRSFGPVEKRHHRRLRNARSISRRFCGVRLDAPDLARVARKLQEFAEEYELEMSIEVSTSRYRDRVAADGPDFFATDDMPRLVDQVIMRAGQWRSDMRCELSFDASDKRSAEFVVEGNDSNGVSGFAHDLERIIAEFRAPFSSISEHLNPPRDQLFSRSTSFVFLILGSIVAIPFHFAIDPFFTSIIASASSNEVQAWANVRAFQMVFTVIAFLIGGEATMSTFRKVLPPVRFVGALSDRNSSWRWHMVWLLSLILIPSIVGVVVNLATK